MQIKTTEQELAEILADYQREFRENPAQFWSDDENAAHTPEQYGAALARNIVDRITERRAAGN